MYRALIADDEPFILEGLSRLIRWEDYGVEVAGLALNGHEACRIIDSTNIQILITDIRMPNMDGLELIQKIRQDGKNIKCIVLSGYSDFEYVRRAAKMGIENYLLKPVDKKEFVSTLIETVNKIENELFLEAEWKEGFDVLRDNILDRWVTGEISCSELQEKAGFLGIDLEAEAFAAVVVKIVVGAGERNIEGNERKHLHMAVKRTCSRIICENISAMTFFNSDEELVIVLTGHNTDLNESNIRRILTECLENINTMQKADIFITAGDCEKDFRSLYRSYNNAKKLQDYCIVMGCNKILFTGDIRASRQKTDFRINGYLNDIGKSVKKREAGSIEKAIDDIFSQFDSIQYPAPYLIQNVAIEILFEIIRTAGILNGNGSPVYGNMKSILSRVYSFQTIGDLKKWLKETSVLCMDMCIENDKMVSPPVKKAIQYADSRYPGNINLSTAALELGYNPFYLGQLFKKETGRTFANYLNTVRIERAKELLGEGNLKMNSIALSIGYANINYFFTMFRKMTGKSPSEYKGG